MMQEMAKLQFKSFAIQLPKDWRQPQGKAGEHLVQALKPEERMAIPNPMNLFQCATTIKQHVDTANKISDLFAAYIDGICGAICSAWSQWQSLASLTGVVIMGPVATLGQVVGPPWMPLIMASAPKASPQELRYSTAIAQAIDLGWTAYQASIKVPGLPWYPAFAAFPGPVTPPMPNVPTPLMALTQVPVSVSKMVLKGAMIGNLGDPMALHHMQLFDAIADAFDKCFKVWQASTQVTNVLGFGPVPTFAPPFVPVGPVMGGSGNMTPGGFV